MSVANGQEWEDQRPWPELEAAALLGIAEDLVHTISPHSEADPVALLLELLVGFGNAVGAGPHARVGGVRHPARLFVAVVGATARGRKGQAHADVGQVLDAADRDWWRDARVSGLSSGEGLIHQLRDREDGTPTERRAFVVEPEFARLLSVAGRDGSTLSPVVRDAWDTGRLQVLTRKDPLLATGAHVSIVAHVTLEELRARLSTTEVANGFANRFMYACARRSKKLPNGGDLSPQEVDRLGERVRQILMLARPRGEMRRTTAAERLWARIYDEIPDAEGLLGAITARAEAQILRLSLTYALLTGAGAIDVPHLEAAHALWRYCEASALHIFGDVLGDDVADRLLVELRNRYPNGLDATQQSAFFGRHVDFPRLQRARDYLLRRNLVRLERIPTRGRSREILVARPRGDLSSPNSHVSPNGGAERGGEA